MTVTARHLPTKRRHPLLRTLGFALLALGGCHVVAIAIAIARLSASPRSADLAVVFGNAVTADGRPSARLRARLDAALALFRRGTVRRVLVSGGVEQPGNLDEAAIMAAYLEENGVPVSAIVQDAAGATLSPNSM